MSGRPSSARPAVAVVGVHGYGASHVGRVLALQAAGEVRLAGLVDPRPGPITCEGHTLDPGALPPFAPTLTALLEATAVDVVIIATPLHTHAPLALQALAAGADVLLEKPPVTSSADLEALLAAERASTGRVQVGFQGLGSAALRALGAALARGELGEVQRIGACGIWTRDRAYWRRAPWAGKRVLVGVDVVDGAITNPFAHAVMGALALADRVSAEAVGRVEVDLYRVNDIEADDTSSLRVHAGAPGGAYEGPVTAAFTLAGPAEALPTLEVVGSAATARLQYTQDRIVMDDPAHRLAGTYRRRDLLEDLLAARTAGSPLIAPLAESGGFVKVAEAVRAASVRRVADGFVRWSGDDDGARPVLVGIEEVVERAVIQSRLFREVGAPWAV